MLVRIGLQPATQVVTLTTNELIMDASTRNILDIGNHNGSFDNTHAQRDQKWSVCSRLSGVVGWFLVVLSCVASAFFLLLYSIEWGKEKSEAWLATFFLSFTESIFVVDPLKVIIEGRHTVRYFYV